MVERKIQIKSSQVKLATVMIRNIVGRISLKNKKKGKAFKTSQRKKDGDLALIL